MFTMGSTRVSIKDGFVVSAVDSEKGKRWSARDHTRAAYPRRLTHLLILAVAAIPMTLTAASAHSAPSAHPRILLAASSADHPEDYRLIPADLPVPVAAPIPTPVPPKPKARPVAFVARPVVVPASKAQIAGIIRAAAARWGANGDQLVRVAMCESGLNANARNASGASGLFQFKPATFYGHGGHNIWDPADQADVAAHMFAQGLAREWTCK